MKTKMILLFLVAGLLVSMFIVGCAEIEKAIDPCKKQYEECKYECGDGWFSGLCKTDCSDRYSNCKARP